MHCTLMHMLIIYYTIVRDSLIAVKWHLIMNLIKMCAGKEIARIYENPVTQFPQLLLDSQGTVDFDFRICRSVSILCGKFQYK